MRRKGYLDGMRLANGSAEAGVGGGICQLRTDVAPQHSFTVEARGEQFLRSEGRVYRRNEIWRRVVDRATGEQVDEELLRSNCARVVYEPGPDVAVTDVG